MGKTSRQRERGFFFPFLSLFPSLYFPFLVKIGFGFLSTSPEKKYVLETFGENIGRQTEASLNRRFQNLYRRVFGTKKSCNNDQSSEYLRDLTMVLKRQEFEFASHIYWKYMREIITNACPKFQTCRMNMTKKHLRKLNLYLLYILSTLNISYYHPYIYFSIQLVNWG